ncbi:hypothetical protein [Sphingopyxis sp. C-1]|uniref:hypothetical protein n=1 Tax=Sphingopyxis sp. C-1 TaxID=262667 RepID=UPI00187C9AF9|nr:hypothetical protein [Sphingopyxis sp. C-1]
MLGAAGITMLRMVVAASFLPVQDFGTYATIAATGAFLSSILSFGTIEGTIKNFPRMVGAGQGGELLRESHHIMRRLLLRAAAVGIPVYAAGLLLDLDWLRLSGLGFFFALSTAYTLVLASMQRASGTSATLAAGTILRSGSVFVAVAAAAYFGDLTILLITEIATTIVACLLSEWLYFRRGRAPAPARLPVPPVPVPPVSGSTGDGVRLFLTYSLISAPFYLDRLFVTSTMGREEGARYAILALFLTGASLIVNTLAQRSGPEAIRLVQRDGDHRAATRLIATWVGISIMIWLAAIGTVAAIIASGFLPESLERYAIAPHLLVPLAVTGVLLNNGLVEFLLLALDRERQMLRAAICFATAVFVAACAVAVCRWGLVEFMWALVACRVIYLALLVAALPTGRDAATKAGTGSRA